MELIKNKRFQIVSSFEIHSKSRYVFGEDFILEPSRNRAIHNILKIPYDTPLMDVIQGVGYIPCTDEILFIFK